jgi:2'-phosphotransferase
MLAHKSLQNTTEADIVRLVQNCSKQRFHLQRFNDETSGVEELYIRANQGHTMQNVQVEMTEINESNSMSQCIHGTYFAAWESIKKNGLSKMARQHIHMSEDFPTSKNVISGMRNNCQVAVFVDVQKALKGLFFFYLACL